MDTGGEAFPKGPTKKIEDYWIGDSFAQSGMTYLDMASLLAMLALVLDHGLTLTTAAEAYSLGQEMVAQKRIIEAL